MKKEIIEKYDSVRTIEELFELLVTLNEQERVELWRIMNEFERNMVEKYCKEL